MTSHKPDMTGAKPDVAEVIAALLKEHAGLDLRLRAWDGSEAGPEKAPVVVIRSPRALQRIAWRPGELGLARAYISGDLDIEGDLTDGLRRVWGILRDTASSDRDAPDRDLPQLAARWIALAPAGWAAAKAAAQLKLLGPPPEPPSCELRVRGRLHSRARDQAVIAGHYDLPAAFYQLILDPTMAYSCADWSPGQAGQAGQAGQTGQTGQADQTGQTDLADAQRAKLELICRKLGLQPGQRLLDMGCGWGSLTIHAAREGIGDRCDAVPRAGRLRPAAGPQPGPVGPGRGPDPGLPGPGGRPL
jgi:cyclopropane-fatty-acyl-phospholipid synthase